MTIGKVAPQPDRAIVEKKNDITGGSCMQDSQACSERFMLVGPERVFYAGLLGRPKRRTLGSFIVFASMQGGLRLSVAGEPDRLVEAAVMPAYREHSIEPEHPSVIGVLVEPDSVDPAAL
ncbi:MAG: hypothetical protein Q8S29_05850, partial [Phreatobacter sp.]|nr:hypothetical protein [Phreatobacter sp.]